MRKTLIAIALLAALPVQAVIITFDTGSSTLIPGTDDLGFESTIIYHEAGFTFTSQATRRSDFKHWTFSGAMRSCGPDPVGVCSFTIAADDGSEFSLDGFTAMTSVYDYCGFAFGQGQASHVGVGPYAVNSCGAMTHIVTGSGLVTSLTLATAGGNFVTVDNMVLSPVPEPETWGLMALGLAALSLRRKRS